LLSIVGLVLILTFVGLALIGPYLAPFDPIEINFSEKLEPPGKEHLFGTDQFGRDILSRVIYGARIALVVIAIVSLIGGGIGTLIGVFSGYFGGRIDTVLMRLTDIFLAFPSLILAMAFSAALGPSLINMIIAISLVIWTPYARLARADALKAKSQDFVEAARSIGASDLRIIFLHILPMCMSSIIVQLTLRMGTILLTVASLGFLGIGAQPPAPEWGAMVSDGRNYIASQWWISTFPGIMIALVVLGFSLLGDGLRDVLDPRLRRG
jgi:ABC-type dipeptide/oligopeptide/nickel transport systems, permease components